MMSDKALTPQVLQGELLPSVSLEDSVHRISEALQRIDQYRRATLREAVIIGQELHSVKAQLPHGEFGEWIHNHWSMSRTEATRYMQVATVFADKLSTMDNLPPLTVAYLVAQVSTPESIRQAVFSGEIPATVADVKAAIEGKKEKQLNPDTFHYSMFVPWAECDPKANAVRGALYIGQLLCKMFENMTIEEVEEFAWFEYRLLPQVSAQCMLYADRYPQKEGTLPQKVVDALAALDAQRNEAVNHILVFLNNRVEYMKRIIHIGRGFMLMQHMHRDNPEYFVKWLQARFQLSVSVAEKVIGYVLTYASTPVEDIPTDDLIWDVADTWTRYALYNVSIRIQGETQD